jgi:hypothetical protein
VAVGDQSIYLRCKICNTEVPLREQESHLRSAHPDIFEKQGRARKSFMRWLVPLEAAAGAGFFLGLFVPEVIFHISEPIWYIAALVAILVIAALVPMPYATKLRRAYVEPVWTILNPCQICDARIPEPMRLMRAHLASEHPAHYRWVRTAWYGFIGSFFGILAALIVTADSMHLLALLDAKTWLLFAASIWMGLWIVWMIVVGRPHIKKVRLAWETSHLT